MMSAPSASVPADLNTARSVVLDRPDRPRADLPRGPYLSPRCLLLRGIAAGMSQCCAFHPRKHDVLGHLHLLFGLNVAV